MVVLKRLALGIVLLVWLVIGPFLWIPLIIRTLGFVTFNLMATVLTGASMLPAQASVDAALGLYGRGFRAAFAILDYDPATVPPPLLPSQGYIRLIWELVYVALFWLGSLTLLLYAIGLSPAELEARFTKSRASAPELNPTKPDALPFAPSPAAIPVYITTQRGFLFKVYRCHRADARVRCNFTIENQQQGDRLFSLGIGRSEATSNINQGGGTLADDRGNGYPSSDGGVGRKSRTDCVYLGCEAQTLALPGVVVPAWIAFDDIDRTATMAKLVRVRFSSDNQWESPAEFRDIFLMPPPPTRPPSMHP
ncbi:MAG: hypothetical protein H7Y20_13325 [Bryobacteraceae bacterium]|nr:hypothetical protein [Bryobacteraceae bacterium]